MVLRKLLSDVIQLAAGDLPQCLIGVGIKEHPDHGQREPERTQRDDPVQALGLGRAIAAVCRWRPVQRPQEPEPVVVVKGSDGDAGRRRKLPDRPLCGLVADHGVDSRS